MMRAQIERQYDELEIEALIAIMHEGAHRAKKPKASDLFKRPVGEQEAEKEVESLKEKADQASEWLAQFKQFNGGFNNEGKEDADVKWHKSYGRREYNAVLAGYDESQ